MASQAKNDGPKVVANVIQLSVADIDPAPTSRIGLFWPEKAEGLAARMLAEGQNDPIKVKRNGNRAKFAWTLVAGAHRLEACRINGSFVDAIEVFGSADDLEAIQTSENLDRRELAPIERAMFVAAVVEAAKRRAYALHGVDNDKALAAKAKAAGSKMLSAERVDKVQFTPVEKADAEADVAAGALFAAYSWSDASAAACGLSIDALKRSLRIYRIIVEPHRHLMDALKSHPVASNASALLAICAKGANPAAVRKIIEWLIAHPEAATADEAMVALNLMPSRGGVATPTTGDTKYLNGLQSNLQRLSLSGQRRAADVIAQAIAPSALVAVRDALNARIAAAEADQKSKGERA